MNTVERHGAGMHLVRPDRVYSTGVLAPMTGYAPGRDAQMVAAEFTKRSQNLGGLALAGAFGAAGQSNFVEKLRLKFEAWAAARFPALVARMKAKAAVRAAKDAAQATVKAAEAQGKAIEKAVKANGPAAAAFAHASSIGQSHGQAFMPDPTRVGMAYAQIGTQVAPHMLGQVRMLARLTSGSMPAAVAQAQVATTMERWHNMRWNG